MDFFSADAKKWRTFFCPQKVEKKTTLKSCSEKLKSAFFSLLPWAAQTTQTEFLSKMWLIDQLYIELGFSLKPRPFMLLPAFQRTVIRQFDENFDIGL